ncbi:Phosphoserine aminotransferase [hydrothermal vent metagenome]|uniref:phosphoserine transaminase n=1 Tax=hydrothermal vent metagenome TaxID=652676 RepID=A0A3B0RHJ3_9ZZZZ
MTITNLVSKPALRPANPQFSSGPCAKLPGWNTDLLKNAMTGRSHRSGEGKKRLQYTIDLTRQVLQVPDDYLIAIVPASDTGAMEIALWSLLGQRGVDMLSWESFGAGWVTDVAKQLKLDDVRTLTAPYGELPDLGQVDFNRDVVFTWNGTTSGARVANADWIAADRKGLTICDATSAAFAQELEFDKLDVVTYSWQKVLGGEAAHGMLILSPRAVERLENYTPPWPLPKIFRLTKKGKINAGIFKGETINTPSMICVEDYVQALEWAKNLGGLEGLIKRADANAAVINAWVERTAWVEHLVVDPTIRSNTSVCLKLSASTTQGLDDDAKAALPKAMVKLLEQEGAALDLGAYRDAPAGLRIWCGATVEASNLEALTPWLDWAFDQASS